jgi:3',5'-nucleoside bisphosphate phosphatase
VNADLHCHSTASDGLLPPATLVARARAGGVTMFALTDHDVVSGLAEARAAAGSEGLAFIDGVEISVTWRGTTLHIVGLRIDPADAELLRGLGAVRGSRVRRARKMAESLEAAGIPGCFEGAMKHVENPEIVSRTHFARHLVERGCARDVRSVFHHYLVQGRPGYVPHEWAVLADAVRWIRGAGGVAVVAHPGRYKLSRPELRELLADFVACGGAGIEVITGNHTPDQFVEFAALAREFGLLASRGSDFHGPGESKVELGALPQLPADLQPVWRDW